MRHPSLHEFISDEQEANLRKLAAYLLTLPADYPDFEMNRFSHDGQGSGWQEAHLPACGTAACAVGHGPAAGIAPIKGEEWSKYSFRCFLPDTGFDSAWDWCFSASWSGLDNTVHGAAKRILWMLEYGLPEDLAAQFEGEVPLCYTDMVLAR